MASAMGHRHFVGSLLWPHRRRLVLAFGVMIAFSVCQLLPPLVFARVVDEVIDKRRWSLLPVLMLLLMLIPVGAVLLRIGSEYAVGLTSQRFLFDLRLGLYRKVQQLSCRYMNTATTGQVLERLRGDVIQLKSVLNNQTLYLIVQVFYGLMALSIMAMISLPLTGIMVAAIVLYYLNYQWFVKRIRAVQRRYRRRMDLLSGRAQERMAGQIVVKSCGTERRESYDFLRQNFLTERTGHRFRMFNVTYGEAAAAITVGANLAVLLYGTRLVILGDLSFGMLLAAVAYAMQLLTPIAQLSELSNQLSQAWVSLGRIRQQMYAEPDVIAQPGGKRLDQLRGEVTFRNVKFSYEPGVPVLKGFNLPVQAGQTVALVGETGCGKSTITNLIYRFYDPDSGAVEVDGVELKDLDVGWYRRRVATVPQDPVVFDTTLRENLAFGRRGATDQQLHDAMDAAELGELIERLPEGLETMVGDEGVQLSVGEKQRLCIARAMLADPRILIMDEATSSLDPRSEALIQTALDRVMRDRTSFVIAHRLATIMDADLIVVIDDGRVLEMGTHHELMARKDGRYRQLFETQSRSAKEAARSA